MVAPKPTLALVLATFALGPLAGSASAADTYTVAPNTTDAAATACSATGTNTFACPNLRSAIATAENDNGSTIQLSAGPYPLTLGHLSINPGSNAITIGGAGAGQTTIEQQGTDRVLNLNSGTMTISGATITGGDLTSSNGTCGNASWVSGGGILNSGTLTLSNVTVTGNKAVGADGTDGFSSTGAPGQGAAGGGICSTGSLTITNSTISDNRAESGSGGAGQSGHDGGEGGPAEGGGIESLGSLTMTGSTISGNSTEGGDGGSAESSSGSGGDADDGGITGGGIDAQGPTGAISIATTMITGNHVIAGDGGDSGSATGNGGTGGDASGSGVDLDGAENVSISDTTISGGTATGGNGGIARSGGKTGGDGGMGAGALEINDRPDATGASVSISSSAIAGNTATGGSLGAGDDGADNGDSGGADGAGVDTDSPGTATLEASTVDENTATASGDGGAFGAGVNVHDAMTIVNSTIFGNKAEAPAPRVHGGGVLVSGILGGGSATLISDTIAGNSANGGNGGNVWGSATTELTLGDTLISSGSTGTSTSANCAGGEITDEGNNLESTAPSQCGLTATSDVIGKDPLLGPLQTNLEPPPTMALGAGSPAIRAGGTCPDPSNPSFKLTTDERGEPRGNPCDIGAFEGQAPHSTASPELGGGSNPGDTLTCTPAFDGDTPIAYTYTWQRGHSSIAGAASATYKVAGQDQGQQLSCTVTATNAYGNAIASSSASTIPKPPKPTVTKLEQSHSVWRGGSTKAKLSSAGKHHRSEPPVGTTFKFKLNTAATVKLTFTTTATGRKVKRKCVKQTRSNRHDGSCKLTKTAGTISFTTGRSGTDKVTFDGRLSGHKKLKPGVYKLVITATNSTGHGTSKSLKFTIAS
jgi:hypothetical protein